MTTHPAFRNGIRSVAGLYDSNDTESVMQRVHDYLDRSD